MRRLSWLACVLLARADPDPRDVVHSGVRIAGDGSSSQYYNQPLALQIPNGSWVVMLTHASHAEGQTNQRVVSRMHVSPNLTEGSWLPPVDIESNPYGPSAGWVVPLFAPELDRLYAIYTFNAHNVTCSGTSQLVGGQWLRWSDDFGATWSDERLEIPIRVTAIDRGNPWNGTELQGWTVSKPLSLPSGAVLVPYTKIGVYPQSHERQWVLRSENILTERDPREIAWATWPEGDGPGCAAADGSDEAEEGSLVSLGGGNVSFIFRSSGGRVNECVSRDDGRSWTPRLVYYETPASPLKNPRGPLTARRLADGSYALLYFNNGWRGYSQAANNTRNPYFLTLGRLSADRDRIVWAQPEVALFGRGWLGEVLAYNLAYPDIVEETPGGRVVIFDVHESPPGSDCQDPAFEALGGCGVATHVVSSEVLAGLASQFAGDRTVASVGLVADDDGAAPIFPDVDASGGLTVEVWRSSPREEALYDCRRGTKGLALRIANGVATLSLNGRDFSYRVGGARQVAAVVDGAPQMVSFVVDGAFGDGGPEAVFGYAHFRHVGDLNAAPTTCEIRAAAKVRVYDRALRTSELVANFRHGVTV